MNLEFFNAMPEYLGDERPTSLARWSYEDEDGNVCGCYQEEDHFCLWERTKYGEQETDWFIQETNPID